MADGDPAPKLRLLHYLLLLQLKPETQSSPQTAMVSVPHFNLDFSLDVLISQCYCCVCQVKDAAKRLRVFHSIAGKHTNIIPRLRPKLARKANAGGKEVVFVYL